MDTLVKDVRYAFATARRGMAFSLAAVLTLALGVGATTAVFSVIDGVLLRPLPYPSPDRLVRLYEEYPGAATPLRDRLLSNLTFYAWLDRGSQTLAGIAAYDGRQYIVGLANEAARLPGAAVSPALFSVLGATPAAGRFFTADEDKTGAGLAVVLSDRLWRERFQANPGVVGQTLLIDGHMHVIVGITQPGFYFPDRGALLWTPYAVSLPSGEGYTRAVSTLFAIGRLKPGATPAQAAAEGTAAARSHGAPPLGTELLFGVGGPAAVRAPTLLEEMTTSVAPALLVAGAGVTLVLLMACGNITNLLLSRSVARQRELAVRAALGASRGRLIRQLLTESVLLCLGGGGMGLLLGWSLIVSAPALAPSGFPRLNDVQMDARVVTFALIATIVAALVSGLAPALRAGELDLSASLRGGHGGTATGFGGSRTRRLRDALLMGQAALAVVLVIGASLLTRSFVHLSHVDGGYDATNVLTARIHLPAASASPERTQQLLERLLERLRSMSTVVAAGGGNMMPFGESTSISGFAMPSRESGEPVVARALEYAVTPGYVEALGLQLREGRRFTQQDAASATSAVLVNEEFTRLYLSRGPVAGRLFAIGLGSSGKVAEIVGVVGNVLKDGLAAKPQPEIYLVLQNGMPMREINLVVRTAANPLALAPTLRRIVREADPSAAVAEVTPLAQLVSASVDQPRFATTVLGAFAAAALSLAGVGLYGVLSFGVSQRRRELGVRAALGACRFDLILLVLRQGMVVTLIGLAIGLVAAAALTRLMEGLLFGVKPLDGMSFAAAPVLLVSVAVAACLRPALQAAATDPAEVLRSE